MSSAKMLNRRMIVKKKKKMAKTSCRSGKGIANWLIKKVPFEMHIPGYQYCGPGTKLEKRLARNDPGINPLDQACKDHDIAYTNLQSTRDRNMADTILANKAWQRAKSSDASISERAAALAITGIMNAKTSMGMGLGARISTFFNHKRTKNGGCNNKKYPTRTTTTMRCRKQKGKGMLKNKKAKQTRKKTKKQKKISVKKIFREAKAKAKEAIHKRSPRTIQAAAQVAEKAAKSTVNRFIKKHHNQQPISPTQVENELRVIAVPKQGAALPLIPIFAGLSALGALMGGSATIANAAISAHKAKKDLSEAQRHNQTMEAIAVGKNANTGSGLYLRPYKTGLGLYLTPNPPHQQQQQLHIQKNL